MYFMVNGNASEIRIATFQLWNHWDGKWKSYHVQFNGIYVNSVHYRNLEFLKYSWKTDTLSHVCSLICSSLQNGDIMYSVLLIYGGENYTSLLSPASVWGCLILFIYGKILSYIWIQLNYIVAHHAQVVDAS